MPFTRLRVIIIEVTVLDSQALYSGEVDLIIAAPLELKAVFRLFNHLQTTSDLKVLRTEGSLDRGTTITVVLDKPTPLISFILETPGVEVTPELLKKSAPAAEKLDLPPAVREKEKETKRIKLTLKEA